MLISIPDATVIAVGGLLVKEVVVGVIKYRAKKNDGNKNGNGSSGLKKVLDSILNQGKLTLEEVGFIKKEQGTMNLELMKVTTQMIGVKEKCVELDKKTCELDDRLFNHIKVGG